jgi:ABC-type sugar transport system ATPase subunit
MKLLEVDNIGRKGNDGWILQHISFTIAPLQKVAIVGETGSGKSSLMKIMAGSGEPDTGEIRFEGEHVPDMREKLLPGHKGIASLTQYFELQKFLSVGQILSYANTLPEAEANELYKICRIDHLLHRRTDQLSGGEKQRTALARLLTTSPKLLLLDEPFSNLDVVHKNILKQVIEDLGKKLNITCVLVSHDPQDILSWADEILVMKNGEIVQRGTPWQVYQKPNSEYVAGLFGLYNLLDKKLLTGNKKIGEPIFFNNKLFVRPEQISIAANPKNKIKGEVEEVLFFGSFYDVKLTIQNQIVWIRTIERSVKKGDSIGIEIKKSS